MEMIFVGVCALILLVVIVSIGRDGLWSNMIVLFNVITAALLATNFWEPLVGWWRSQAPGGVYVWDILAIWGLFAVFYSALKGLTDLASRVRVRFPPMVDLIGSYCLALWAGCAVVCFMFMTLHLAPLSRNFLWGAFQPEKPMVLSLAPDRQWLGFVQKMSRGSFSRMAPADNPEAHVFDPSGTFMTKFATRRETMEKGIVVWAKDLK